MNMFAVPAWPIITLRWEGEVLLVNDSEASLDLSRVLPLPEEDPSETARRAAVEACKSLHMDRARVEGIDGDEVLSLVVDARQETLTVAHALAGPAPLMDRTNTAIDRLRVRAGRSRYAKISLPLVGVLTAGATLSGQVGARTSKGRLWAKTRQGRKTVTTAIVVACLIATGGVVEGQRSGWFPTSARSVQVAAPAPAGQLPIYAPTGWQTFAAWMVPAAQMSVDPVISPDGKQIITVSSGHLEALDSRTGASLWTTTLEGTVSALAILAVDGTQKIVVTDGNKVRLFSLAGTTEAVVEAGDTTSQPVLDTGREMFFTLPDQQAMVLVNGSLSLRRIPAGAVPVGVDRGALLAVEISSGKMWRITADAVAFPDPVKLPIPRGATSLTAVYTAPDGSLVTVWNGSATSNTAIISVLPVFPQLGAATVTTEVPVSATNTSTAVMDRYSGTVLIDQVLIDTRKHLVIVVPSSSGKLGAGYWWGTQNQDSVRFSPTGQSLPSPADAPVPLFALPNHRVLVEAGTDQSLYALAPEGETK